MKMDFRNFLDLITKDEPSSLECLDIIYKQKPTLRKDFSCPFL